MKLSPMFLAMSLALPMLCTVEPRAAQAQVVQSYFRVSIVGFRCNARTLESAISIDGAGDEVYALANVLEISAGNTITNSLVRESLVYGDTAGRSAPFTFPSGLDHGPPRIKAGSAAATGGLQGGESAPDPRTTPAPNRYRPYRERLLPMIVWQGPLRRGGPTANGVLILPTLWDVDMTRALRQVWDSQSAEYMKRIALHSAGFVSGTERRPLVTQSDVVLRWIPNQNDFDKPIGIAGAGFNPGAAAPDPATFIPAVMFLTFDAAVEAASATSRSTQGRRGVIELKYTDADNYGHGDYTMFLQVERISS